MIERPPTALITGASSGIGRATAARFARAGYRVFGTSRSSRPSRDSIEMLELDVRSETSARACVAEIENRCGPIDVLVNNAGTPCLGLVEELPLERAHNAFEVNALGPVRVLRAALPAMRARRKGRIINVGSLAAWVGEPGDGYYSASKHALAGITEALHHELWPFNVHVSLVELGEFRTGFLEHETLGFGTIPDYMPIRNAVARTFQAALNGGEDPDNAARLILRVARTRVPKRRYALGKPPMLAPLKVLAPQSMFDALVRKGFGLERVP